METEAELAFVIHALEEDPRVVSLTPILNGTPLSQMVASFERTKGFEPVGGYTGIVPENFRFGPLEAYFMGQSNDPLFSEGVYLLGCTCGEVGCWPLRGRISKRGEVMVWDRFHQPHRPERDYSEFGPFSFELGAYDRAVRDAVARLQSRLLT